MCAACAMLAYMVIREAKAEDWPAIWPILAMQFNAVVETNTPTIGLWRSFGLEILATVPEAFQHPAHGYVGLHIMYKRL